MAEGLSLRGYAKRRGCALSTVQEAIRTGRLAKSVTKDEQNRYSIDAELADQEWAASTHTDRAPLTGPTAPASAGEGGEGGDTPSLSVARIRHENAKAALAELELGERLGELVEAKDLEARLVGVFASCRQKILGVPSRLRQRDPSLSAEQLAVIEEELREALSDLGSDAQQPTTADGAAA